MKNRFFTMLAALVLMLGVAGTAQAQAVVTKTSTAQLESILKQEGYSYTVDKDGDLVLKLDGYTALLLIDKDKQSILFRAAFDQNVPLSRINDWNRTKKYSRSYLEHEKDPVLELDLDLEGGVTQARIANFLQTSSISFSAWRNEVLVDKD